MFSLERVPARFFIRFFFFFRATAQLRAFFSSLPCPIRYRFQTRSDKAFGSGVNLVGTVRRQGCDFGKKSASLLPPGQGSKKTQESAGYRVRPAKKITFSNFCQNRGVQTLKTWIWYFFFSFSSRGSADGKFTFQKWDSKLPTKIWSKHTLKNSEVPKVSIL